MPDINQPMTIPELKLKPPIDGKIKLSPDMQQTLALLTAYGDNARKLLMASESGVLYVASARIRDIVHYTKTNGSDPTEGDNVPCTECLIMGHPENTGTVWVRPDKTAELTKSWPLAAGEVVNFTLNNLKQLKMNIVTVDDTVIVAYSR